MADLTKPPDWDAQMTLRAQRVAAQRFISPRMAQYVMGAQPRQDMQIEHYMSAALEELVVVLSTTLYAEDIAEQEVFRTEKIEWTTVDGPWQRFKMRHLASWWLGWLVRWRPVRFIHDEQYVTLKVARTCWHAYPANSLIPSPQQFPYLGSPVRKQTYQAETSHSREDPR